MKIDCNLETLVFDARGLIPVVVQDVTSSAVLMMAWADREALHRTLETGCAHFWSRSRRRLWKKGEISGNTLRVVSMVADCDRDTLLVRALPDGPTCHLGRRSCFEPNPAQLELGWLSEVLKDRLAADDEGSYTARLSRQGRSRIAQKVGEEAVETVIAALESDGTVADEAADLVYHLLVLLLDCGLDAEDVANVLKSRARPSTGDEQPGASAS